MPILHYKLTSNNETINLPSEIHSQSFLLRRIMVQMVPLTGTNVTLNNGGCVCQPTHLSGLEIISGNSSNSNDILVAYDENIATHNIYYDMEFDSESVPRGFQVKTFKFNYNQSLGIAGYDPLAKFITKPTPAVPSPARVDGEIISVDLFFQFSSLYNYESY